MLSFEILREEHHSFERALKVLNKVLLTNNFSPRYFTDFFFTLYEVLIAHLKKEKILFTHLPITPNLPDESIPSFFNSILLDKIVKEKIEGAKESLTKNEMVDFCFYTEEFILFFSRHIFQQEEEIFSNEDSLSEKVDKKVARLFDECHPPPKRKGVWNSFLFFLEEMERVFG